MESQLFEKHTSFVKRYIELYNSHNLRNGTRNKQYNLDLYQTFYIPNNGLKMYCVIINNILYFFYTEESTGKIKDDFYIKIPNVFDKNYFIEGYLYGKEYKVTDIMMINNDVISSNSSNTSYSRRYNLVHQIFNKQTLDKLINLNNKITFLVHPVFTEIIDNPQDEYIETVSGNSKCNTRVVLDNTFKGDKIIRRGKYSDVYHVFDAESLNEQGILYVKTLSDSLYLQKLFKDSPENRLQCIYNSKFKKYQVYISTVE